MRVFEIVLRKTFFNNTLFLEKRPSWRGRAKKKKEKKEKEKKEKKEKKRKRRKILITKKYIVEKRFP